MLETPEPWLSRDYLASILEGGKEYRVENALSMLLRMPEKVGVKEHTVKHCHQRSSL